MGRHLIFEPERFNLTGAAMRVNKTLLRRTG